MADAEEIICVNVAIPVGERERTSGILTMPAGDIE